MINSEGPKNSIATRLRIAREQAGLTQGQVAKLLSVHRPTVSEIEAGRRKVSADEVRMFADIYGVDTDWLIGGEQSDAGRDRVELAARELSKLKDKDLDLVLDLLKTLRKPGSGHEA